MKFPAVTSEFAKHSLAIDTVVITVFIVDK